VLVTSIFRSYFVGLPEGQSRELQKVEQYLKNITGDVSNVNQWRSTTLAILRKGAMEELQDNTDAVIDSVVKRINDIMDDISDVKGSETRDQSLKALINSSIDLSRLVRVQKAVFKMVMPVIEGHQIHTFDVKTMEDIGGEDEDTLEGREICCVTFPGMVKEGDESGEHAQFRNVIAKARVLCSPD
jgi:activating signal cointegrator complex subunit 1